MSNLFYAQVVTGFSHTLLSLSQVLDKAAAHAERSGFDAQNLLTARLFPDMFPCTRQFQIATDVAKGAAARLSGGEAPRWEDTEQTVAELQARLTKVRDYLATFTAAQFDGAASRAIEVKTPAGAFSFTGETFLHRWAVPNFYFHCTTAYNLLRHGGVPVGKFDFLGAL
ncbi:MAG: DUF1993 domain-containing protein [Gammaproteobacteria bacterium]|nr:DUF1993 domain-containing protein [Gammaproteobacteria bacterium]